MPNPAEDLPYVSAIWHYAQGIAAVRQQRDDDAASHLAALRTLAADPVMDTLTMWDRYPLSHAVRIAERTLGAEVAAAGGDLDGAIAMLREAADIEDRIPYDEPPGWHAPVRHSLGALLLAAERPNEAEAVYRAELERNPGNGWSLHGLTRSLQAQGRSDEAGEVEQRFKDAWQYADVELVASRM